MVLEQRLRARARSCVSQIAKRRDVLQTISAVIVLMMDGRGATLAGVPCAPNGRIHISWGLGNEMFCCDVRGISGWESQASCVQW